MKLISSTKNLTQREREVSLLSEQGITPAEIGRRINVSSVKVKAYLESARLKSQEEIWLEGADKGAAPSPTLPRRYGL